MLRKIIYAGIICAISIGVSAQDVHYSQYFNSPFNLNPGLVGVFDGDIRLHGNYRFQWARPEASYRSLDLGADMKFIETCKLDINSRDKNYFSLGAIVNSDRAGDLALAATSFHLLGSYSLGIGENVLLTPGISLGYINRGFDFAQAFWPDTGQGNTDGGIDNNSLNYFDLSGGVNLRYQTSFRKKLDIGAALYHWLSPSQKFSTSTSYEADLAPKLNLYGMLNWKLASRLDGIINALYSSQNPYQEIVLNGQAKLYLDSGLSKALFLGAGVRIADAGDTSIDAWYPMIALQLNQFYASFSYDVNISEFDWATSGRGGPEVALRYIICRPRTQPFKPCPIY